MSALNYCDANSFRRKESELQDIKAIILDRGSRKHWYVRYQMFFENGSVKTTEESSKVLKTEKSLEYMQAKFLPAWIAKKKEELRLSGKRKDFGYYAEMFEKNFEANHSYDVVKHQIRRIIAAFGKRELTSITKLELKQWLNGLTNPQTGAGIEKSTKSRYLRIFHGVYELALDDGLIQDNWTYQIKLHGDGRKEDEKPFEPEEVRILLSASKDLIYGEYLHNYLGIAFNQGMSPAEIIGLQVGDIDFKKQLITVRRNITKGSFKDTKTVYRDRTIPMFDTAKPYFEALAHEARQKRSIWLFSDGNGQNLKDIEDIRGERQIIKDNRKIKANTKWYKLLADTGIEYRDLKNTRHTFAVSALESKAFTMQQVADILGHGSLKMVMEVYAKYVKNKGIKADKTINLFGDTLGDTLINKVC